MGVQDQHLPGGVGLGVDADRQQNQKDRRTSHGTDLSEKGFGEDKGPFKTVVDDAHHIPYHIPAAAQVKS
jgi:hypothetical protein